MVSQHFTKRYGVQVVITLLLFLISSIICYGAFFNGFIQSFSWYNHKFFHAHIPPFLSYMPYKQGYSIILSSLFNSYFTGCLLLLYIPFLLKRNRQSTGIYSGTDRTIVFVCAAILVWELCTYNYNYYLDAAFYIDRIILIVLALSLLKTPLTIPVFTAAALVYRAQYNYPLEGFPMPDKKVLFDILILYIALIYSRKLVKNYMLTFLFLVLCVVASNYFISGVTKIAMSPHGYEWIAYNNPADLFMNMHYRGWLANTGSNVITFIYSFLNNYGKPLQALVLLLELCCFFLLRNRKMAITLLILTTLMHVFIFIAGSMFFWKWMIVDITLIYILIAQKNSDYIRSIFTKQNFSASIPIILTSLIWLHPVKVGWFDTPLTQYISFEAVDSSGRAFNFNRNDFNPYHQGFQYDKFNYLIDQKLVRVSGFGATNDFNLVKTIKQAGPNGVQAVSQQQGINYFNADLKNKFDIFIKTFFYHYNKRLTRVFLPALFKAPDHLYTSVTPPVYTAKEPIRTFRVVFNQAYTTNGTPTIIQRKTIDEIEIPQ